MLGSDQLFFDGSSLTRLREVGARPIPYRLFIVTYSAATEEILYRLGVATLAAWIIYRLSSTPLGRAARPLSEHAGVVVAAVLFGLAHVQNLPDVAHPLLRALTLNGAAGLVLGWLYWRRGLECAIAVHLLAVLVLYIAVPPFI
jgi:membrane protease YdiL (CAAX protease family)